MGRGANGTVKFASSGELRGRTTQKLPPGQPLMAGMFVLAAPIVNNNGKPHVVREPEFLMLRSAHLERVQIWLFHYPYLTIGAHSIGNLRCGPER